MANTEGEPVLNPEEEEIALSDSELDNVLKSASVTSEPAGGAEENLDQYGVWVKVEPQNVEEEAEENMAFELSDLESDHESALTDEEEQLLGELEDNDEDDLAGLSGLEEDLEELGKGAEFADEEGEELTVEDLDVDLDDLGDDNLAVPEEAGALEGLPEMEGEEEFGIDIEADTDIEVPLSDSAVVEEHYEDLATVEGVPSTPGQVPLKASSSILEKIEQDLNQIKAEIQSLKSELVGLGKGGLPSGKGEAAPASADSDGFFQKGEEETIALTGDELDNILNTADVTEEVEGPEEGVESLEEEELPEEDLPAEVPAAEVPEEIGPLAEPDEEIMELGSLDLEEEAPLEELTLEDSELSLEELEPSAAEDESIEIDIGEKSEEELLLDESESFEDIEELSLDEELGTLEGETEEIEDLNLEEPEDVPVLEEIEELEELSLEAPEDESELGEAGEAEEISLAEPATESELGEIEELENISLEEPDADSSLEEVEEIEELSLEELTGEEDSSQDDVLALGDLEDTGLEAEDTENLELAEEELSTPEEPEDLEVEELGSLEEESEEPQLQASSQVLPQDLQSDIKSVLSYLDQLFEALPEEKIKEFAQSDYFGIYKRLFEELGLGA